MMLGGCRPQLTKYSFAAFCPRSLRLDSYKFKSSETLQFFAKLFEEVIDACVQKDFRLGFRSYWKSLATVKD